MNIKPEKKEQYERWVSVNQKDEYSKACVDAMWAVMARLEDGASCEDAHEAMLGHGLTGFMASMVANGVARFDMRGDEWRDYWNEKHGIKTDKGTVNLATGTLEDNGTFTPDIDPVTH